MLPVTASTVRLFLHILGATVWIGGQITLAGLVPVLRKHTDIETVRLAGRRFQVIAWSAFLLLLVTGIWNLFAVKVGDQTSDYDATLFAKLVFVALSGLCAAGHAFRLRFSGLLAAGGLLFALAAAFYGITLHG